jgi:hypothetical protein
LHVDESKNYLAAQSDCEARGSGITLAKIESADQNTFATNMLTTGESALIYYKYSSTDGTSPTTWPDESEICYGDDWQPTWYSNSGAYLEAVSCTVLRQADKYWDDFQCNQGTTFLCSYDRVFNPLCPNVTTTTRAIYTWGETKTLSASIEVATSLNASVVLLPKVTTALELSFGADVNITSISFRLYSSAGGSFSRRLTTTYLVDFTLEYDPQDESSILTEYNLLKTTPSVLGVLLVSNGYASQSDFSFLGFGSYVVTTTTTTTGLPNENLNNWSPNYEWFEKTTTGETVTSQEQSTTTTKKVQATADQEYIDESRPSGLSIFVCLALAVRFVMM